MTPKRAYSEQKKHAKERGIDWKFTYEEWLEMWLVSGKWYERGKGRGKYQMCRYGDEGCYSKINCYIGTMEQNQADTRKYTDQQAKEMWGIYREGGVSQYKLAEMYKIDQSTVSKILSGKRRMVNENS